jgi:hypothetical protein
MRNENGSSTNVSAIGTINVPFNLFRDFLVMTQFKFSFFSKYAKPQSAQGVKSSLSYDGLLPSSDLKKAIFNRY